MVTNYRESTNTISRKKNNKKNYKNRAKKKRNNAAWDHVAVTGNHQTYINPRPIQVYHALPPQNMLIGAGDIKVANIYGTTSTCD